MRIHDFALRLERILVRIQSTLVGSCMLGIVICTGLGIYFRLARISVPWTNELAQIFLIWMMFSAATLGIYYKEHVGMLALVDRLPRRTRKLTLILAQFGVLLFCAYVAVTGTWYVSFSQRMGGGTISLPYEIPSYVIALILPITFTIGTFHALLGLFHLESDHAPAAETVGQEHAFY